MIVYGMPTHRLITMTVTRAHVASVKNGIGLSIQPQFMRMRLIAPCGWSIWCMTSSETNCGTAIDIEKTARQKPLPCVVLRLMTMARNRPQKKLRNVAKNAQINVQPSTDMNSRAETMLPELLNTVLKFSKPTQSNSTRWLWS